MKIRRRQEWHIRCWQASFAEREAGTSERHVRHSTSFSGVGGFGGGFGIGFWVGFGALNMDPRRLEGRSGFRRKGVGCSCLVSGGEGLAETGETGLDLWTEVLLRCSGG